MTERDGISLWEETLDALKKNGKSWGDVTDIRIGDKLMPKDDFEKHAKALVYEPWCYGGNTVSLKLRMYGDGFVLFRQEYDGSEWWELLGTRPVETDEIATEFRDLLDEHTTLFKEQAHE